MHPRHALNGFTLVALLCAAAAHAQLPRPVFAPGVPVAPHAGQAPSASLLSEDDRSGPRVGIAYIFGGSVTAERAGRSFTPLTTLFGWQIEHQFDTGVTNAPLPMTELVALVGGLEQGLFLPSVSWMVGMRQPNGWEAGVGPTLTGAGVQLAVAAGVTRSIGRVNLPVNLAVAPGRRGASVSVTTGFNVTSR